MSPIPRTPPRPHEMLKEILKDMKSVKEHMTKVDEHMKKIEAMSPAIAAMELLPCVVQSSLKERAIAG